MRDIGKNIRDIRISQNMTQDTLAEILFVTRQTVSNYENGRSRPDIDMLLRIADVLNTDVNTILYGVTVPESKRNAYNRLWAALGILAGSVIAYMLIYVISKQDIFNYHGLLQIGKLLFLPVAAFLSGWILLHTLGMFCNLKQLEGRKRKVCKIVLWSCTGIIAVSILPHVVFSIVSVIRSLTEDSYSMSMGFPVWSQISHAVVLVTYRFPFLYTVLGGAFWMAGIPAKQKDKSK